MNDRNVRDDQDSGAGASGTPPAASHEPSDPPGTADRSACLRCGSTLESGGIVEFRTGGHGGAAHFFFGNLADLSESQLPFELFVCPACGHVELFRAW